MAAAPTVPATGPPPTPWAERLDRWPGLLRRGGRPFGRRDAVATTILYLGAVVAFSAAAIAVSVGLGDPLLSGQVPSGGKSGLDAIWHLLTAFVLVLPLRRRLAYLLAPLLSLGIDIDHIFGSFLPYVVGRQAHDVFFLVLVTLFLYAIEGRPAALLGAGAVVTHIAVDGGTFPFFAPATLAQFPLPYGVEVGLLVVAAVLFHLAYRPARELASPRTGGALAVVVVTVSVAVLFFPLLFSFNTF